MCFPLNIEDDIGRHSPVRHSLHRRRQKEVKPVVVASGGGLVVHSCRRRQPPQSSDPLRSDFNRKCSDHAAGPECPPTLPPLLPTWTSVRYWDYYDKVLSGPRPLLGPKGMLLADNVLFHELVPVAEEMAAASAAPAQNSESVAGEEEKIGAIVSDRGVGLQESLPGRGDKLPVVVGRGVLPATPRRLKIAESLDGFNKRVKEDGRVEVVMLPLRDGLSVVTWRRGGFPTGEEA